MDRVSWKAAFSATALAAAFWIAGCGAPAESPSPANSGTPPAGGDAPAGDEHNHPTEGPHHGGLVELGNEEYHAEVVHDDAAGTVTVYILDSSAKSAVPVDAPEVTINVTHDGQPEQFKLPAAPDSGDPQGKSSRFSITHKELIEHLDEAGATAKLTLTIDGKPYNGLIEHDHEHEAGHKH
jgi:hypothetical protein